MPTERFYRLPEEKKKAILKAAMYEFSRVPLESVSINKIIQNAEISRGSFYTYFEDKREVMRYILEEMNRELRTYLRECLSENGGDIYNAAERVLIKGMQRCQRKSEDYQFFQNILTGSNEIGELFDENIQENKCDTMIEMLLCDGCVIPKGYEKEFKEVLQVLQALIIQTFGMKFIGRKTDEELLEEFRFKVDLIRRGFQDFCKEEKERNTEEKARNTGET